MWQYVAIFRTFRLLQVYTPDFYVAVCGSFLTNPNDGRSNFRIN